MLKYRKLMLIYAIFLTFGIVFLLRFAYVYAADTVDLSQWNTAGWVETNEYDEVVLTANNTTENASLVYKGSMSNVTSVEADIRYNISRWGEASGGFLLTTSTGVEWFVDYRADANAVRIRRNGSYIIYDTLKFIPKADEWIHFMLTWNNSNLYVLVNENVFLNCNYASYGDIFNGSSTFKFYEWGQPMSVKNMRLSSVLLNAWMPNSTWIKEKENEDDVFSAQIPKFNDSVWPNLSYNGSLQDVNSIGYKLRYNKTWFEEAWGGLVLTDANSNEWIIDYRADANAVRIRRNGNYLSAAELNFVPTADEWVDFQVIWSDSAIYLKVKNQIVLEAKYSSFNDKFNNDASICFKCWGQPISVKNITIESVKPSAWNFVDLEFKSSYSVETFKVLNGSAKHQDGQMIVDITAGGMSMESDRIEVSPGSMYSAFLPLRNTLVVRLKNNSAADRIECYFISTLHQEYSKACSKTFTIKPYSDYTTYFFNLSDVIYMGNAANPYKYTSQVMDSEGYLRGFKIVLPESVTEGTIAIDAITFEREEPTYNYLGEILSTIADRKTELITIKGHVDSSFAEKTITVYESAVNNYNQAMSYPINTEYKTEMVDIEKLTTTIVQSDGSFTAMIPLYAEDGISRLSSLFLALIDGKKVSGHFSVENYEDFIDVKRFDVPDFVVNVTDPLFGAKGDAFTDDTKAIQAAIDYTASQGGGVVLLPGDTSTWYGRRYIATNINLKSNIELRIEKGAMIWQSQREEDYDYSNNVFTKRPIYGHDNDREGIAWAHSINDNLPLIYVGGGYDHVTKKWGDPISNVRICGGGSIRMMDVGGEQPDPHNYAWNSNINVGCANRIHIAPVVFWNAENCDLLDMTIQRTNSWHITTNSSKNIYYANNTLEQAACINSDSFGCTNSKDLTIFRNFVYGNDDGVTLVTCNEEKRAHVFYFVDADRDNATENVNIISNQIWNGLGIAFIPWGSGGSDASKYVIKNIRIYDNVLGGESCAIGSWPDNPTYGWSSYNNYNLDNGEIDDWSAIQDVYIVNNRLRKPYNLRLVQVTNMVIENTCYKGQPINYYQSRAAKNFLHGDFDKIIRSTEEVNGFKDESNWVVGLTNWSSSVGTNGSVGTEKIRSDLKYSGYIKGEGELWQGIYLLLGAQKLTLKVYAKSGNSRVFVADHEGHIIDEKSIAVNGDFEVIIFDFIVNASGTYRLGVKHNGDAQDVVYLDDADVVRSELNSIEIENATTVTYSFENATELEDFKLLTSGGGGFKLVDNKLVAEGINGEYKAVLYDLERKYWSASVEIHPGKSGQINAGLYIGVANASNKQDSINALSIIVESNFKGWSDAANRVDLVIGSFPDWIELGRYISETGFGNNLFTEGVKEPLKLQVDINGTIITVTLSLARDKNVFIQTVYEYQGKYDLQHGAIGLRALNNDVQFDNLILKYTEESPSLDEDPDNTFSDENITDLVDFENKDCEDQFDFFSSSKGGFVIKNGKLVPTGEDGQFKAILKGDNRKYQSISIDIYPAASGKINACLYIGASDAGNDVDKINALGILVQSNYDGSEDEVNRIDLIVGSFPKWKELNRTISKPSNNNNLFTNGVKEPLRLKAEIAGNKVIITLSLISNPKVSIQAEYEYNEIDNLASGAVGICSMFNDSCFDNFAVFYTENTHFAPKKDYTIYIMAVISLVVVASSLALFFVIKKKRSHSVK